LAKSKASANDVPFWHLYAILAWEQNDRSAALESEKRLYLLGAADEYDYQRLIMLTQDPLPKAALAVAMAGWHKFKLPIFFFESIALAANQQDWHELRQLLAQIPESDPMGLKQYPAYWIALAQWEVSNHRPQSALNAYAQGLELSPGDPVIQEDILWLLVDEHDEKNLRAILVGDLGSFPNLQAALIGAMQILHRPNLAMYLQSQQRIPADDQALLNRADILNSNGLDGLAWAQRTIVAQDIAQKMQRKNKNKEKTS
ncbi:MAG: tetratricopeptide repeat protein, partial [Candidatus Cloacimonas sp.]|nr:tetratricopeptide repeat protein [Candidatus Cloacimonas sp.]